MHLEHIPQQARTIMGSEWGRTEIQCLRELYAEMEWDTDTKDFKKRVALIMKVDLQKLKEAAGSVKRAVDKVKLDWGDKEDYLIRGWNKNLTWEECKKKLSDVAEGTWKVDTACPSSFADGKRPYRRYVNMEVDGGRMYVRVIKEDNGTYTVQQGTPKEPPEADEEEEEEEETKKTKRSSAKGHGSKRTKKGAGAEEVPVEEPEEVPADLAKPNKRGARGAAKNRGK